MIHLEDIDVNNWREKLTVCDDQKDFVAEPSKIMARAYVYRNYRSILKMIYNDDTPVGMILFYDYPDLGGYELSQLLIDKQYQKKGYGTEAVKLALQIMKNDGKYKKVFLCYIEGNEAAKNMYLKLGFKHTGECDEDEIMMCLDL